MDYIYEQLLSIQMQAVVMLGSQLRKMLQLEGLFYKAGTLIVAVGGGSVAEIVENAVESMCLQRCRCMDFLYEG